MHSNSKTLLLLLCLALVGAGVACDGSRTPTDQEQDGREEVPSDCEDAPASDGPWEGPRLSCSDRAPESEEQGAGPHLVAADLLSLCPDWDPSYAEDAARLLAAGIDQRPRFAATDASCTLDTAAPHPFYLLTVDPATGSGTWGLFEVSDVLSWRAVVESELPANLNVVVLGPAAPGTETTSEGI